MIFYRVQFNNDRFKIWLSISKEFILIVKNYFQRLRFFSVDLIPFRVVLILLMLFHK